MEKCGDTLEALVLYQITVGEHYFNKSNSKQKQMQQHSLLSFSKEYCQGYEGLGLLTQFQCT